MYSLIFHFHISAHQNRVTAVLYTVSCEWVLSCGKDKYFQWHCSESGRRLGGYQTAAQCTCLAYPSLSIRYFLLQLSLNNVLINVIDNIVNIVQEEVTLSHLKLKEAKSHFEIFLYNPSQLQKNHLRL